MPIDRRKRNGPRDARLARIADALAADLADNRRLEEWPDWADWAGIGALTMSRRFVAETGLTFAQWRQQARLLRALEKIADGVPVTTIALDLGYDNVSAFFDMFRRTLGTLPGRIRLPSRPRRCGSGERRWAFAGVACTSVRQAPSFAQ